MSWRRADERVRSLWQCQLQAVVTVVYQPADFEARRRLRSASSSSLVVRRTRLSTIGDRAFPFAAARIWNGLPPHVTSAPSLPIFRNRLKTHLFRRYFPWLHLLFFVVPVKWLVIIGHVNRSFYLLFYLLTGKGSKTVLWSSPEQFRLICVQLQTVRRRPVFDFRNTAFKPNHASRYIATSTMDYSSVSSL